MPSQSHTLCYVEIWTKFCGHCFKASTLSCYMLHLIGSNNVNGLKSSNIIEECMACNILVSTEIWVNNIMSI